MTLRPLGSDLANRRGQYTEAQGHAVGARSADAAKREGVRAVPVISMFYGILIRMYFFDDKQHHMAHIHAEYAGAKAVFAISDGNMLAGTLPAGKTRLVQAWIEIHREELEGDWQLAVNGEAPFRIEPLK